MRFLLYYCLTKHHIECVTLRTSKRYQVEGRNSPLAMGWHRMVNTTSGQQNASPGELFTTFHCCFTFVDRERSPEILVQLNLGLCDILESSISSCTHIVHWIAIT